LVRSKASIRRKQVATFSQALQFLFAHGLEIARDAQISCNIFIESIPLIVVATGKPSRNAAFLQL